MHSILYAMSHRAIVVFFTLHSSHFTPHSSFKIPSATCRSVLRLSIAAFCMMR